MTPPVTAQALARIAELLRGWADFLALESSSMNRAEVDEHRALADACEAESRTREALPLP